MSTFTATYSPEDNKLRLYASSRLDPELYARVKAAGFSWAPKQELFVAPAWTPEREDLLIDLAGEVGDEDTSLVERAEERAERFDGYHEARASDAESARASVASIADGIPFGQPILVGHHSEAHARRDAERIENGMRRAVKMWQTAAYWRGRAAGALRHAKYKERPDVRARRIKTLEAEERKVRKDHDQAARYLRLWEKIHEPDSIKRKDGAPTTAHDRARYLANVDHVSMCFPLSEYPRREPASLYEGAMELWSALGDTPEQAIITPEQAAALASRAHRAHIARSARWLEHLGFRLEYERAMLAGQGGTVADRNAPEVGGGVKCWASCRGGWSYVQKVNKVSVTVLDNWGRGGRNFTRTIPFDKLGAVMSRADVEAKRAAGVLRDLDDKTGFLLFEDSPLPTKPPEVPETRGADTDSQAPFEALKEQLKAGVQVVVAPQLFPTPPGLAARMVGLAQLALAPGQPTLRVLEPSAGTGALLRPILAAQPGRVVAVEVNGALAEDLRRTLGGAFGVEVHQGDFLACNGSLGVFDRVVMNPPFGDAADIRHIEHALGLLRPGGRLVALCANGTRQQAALRHLAETWEELPSGTFDGTGVRAVLLSIAKELGR